MASAAPSGDDVVECPVCHDGYKEPKILPCTHRVCGQCVLSWLQKKEGQAGCPLCREPILPSTHQGQGDLATQVDVLPTDLALVAVMESEKILQGRHVCSVCDNDVPATSYCLQCDYKLCKSCTNYHPKIPSSRDHILQPLGKLTAQRLASSRRSVCKTHSDRPNELYCPTHQQVMCLLCATTTHEGCSGKKTITDMAKVTRAELTQRVQRLRDMKSSLAQDLIQVKENFKVMYRTTKDTFDDLQQALDKRRHEVNTKIKKDEVAAMTSLPTREKHRAALKFNTASVEQLVVTSPDEALLDMLRSLTSRLDDLESQTSKLPKTVAKVTFELQTLTRLKTAIGNLGQVSHDGATVSPSQECCPTCGQTQSQSVTPSRPPSSATTTTTAAAVKIKPTGAELARVLKEGDRVRRGRGWIGGSRDGTPPGPGTVTEIGQRLPTGLVAVRWDATGFPCLHYMGDSHYELELL